MHSACTYVNLYPTTFRPDKHVALCFLTVTGNGAHNQPNVVLINHRTSVSVSVPIWAPFVDWCVCVCVRIRVPWHFGTCATL